MKSKRQYRMRTSSAIRQVAATTIILVIALLSISTIITAEVNNNDIIDIQQTPDDGTAIVSQPPSSDDDSRDEAIIVNIPAPHSSAPKSVHVNEQTVSATNNNKNDHVHVVEKEKQISSPAPTADNPNDQHKHNEDINEEEQSAQSSIKSSSSRRPLPSFNTLFTPHLEEYTLAKFDPYSFSGAPLGGWGRATRSRLASLPIRLVGDYNGGLQLLTNEGGEEDGTLAGEDNNIVTNGGEDVNHNSIADSTGPHFTFRDGMGRQFVCRAYDEGVLEVESYMNSMFSPAVLLGDDTDDGRETTDESVQAKRKETDLNDEETAPRKDISVSVETIVIDGTSDDENNIAEAITSNIQNLMEEMRLVLDAEFGEEDILLEAVMGDDINGIVEAAMRGAGINGVTTGGAEVTLSDLAIPRTPPKSHSTQLTPDQIFEGLGKLKDFCSQLHLGWWSYEWCYGTYFQQFHVDVSSDPNAPDGRKYKITDQKYIGQYDGKTTIVNPKGMYDGEKREGSSVTYEQVSRDKRKELSTRVHDQSDDEEYAKPFYDREKDMKPIMTNRLKNELQKYKNEQRENLGHNGGIVKQEYQRGDMCHEIGIQRQVSVEYRCCTEEEILHWIRAKENNQIQKRDDVPPAVLVAVQEFETCDYRAKVCTTVLCPESLTRGGMTPSSVANTKNAPQNVPDNIDEFKTVTPMGEKEATRAVYRAIGNVVGANDLNIILFSKEAKDLKNHLVRAAQEGVDFRKLSTYRKLIEVLEREKQNNEDGKNADPLESVEGKSIREVLQNTLGGRPCLSKNLGW